MTSNTAKRPAGPATKVPGPVLLDTDVLVIGSIYAVTALRMVPDAFRGWWRRRQVGVAFRGDTLQRGNP